MMVVEAIEDIVCWCVCYSRGVMTVRYNITCSECIELCTREDAKRFEFQCFKQSPPPDEEVLYEDEEGEV